MKETLKNVFPGNFFTRYLEATLGDVLPLKFKRMFYITSAFAFVIKNTSPDTLVLKRIANSLKLGYDPDSMRFPAFISGRVWKNLDLSDFTEEEQALLATSKAASDKDLWKMGVAFATHCPAMLQYGSGCVMSADIHDMLAMVIKVQPTA